MNPRFVTLIRLLLKAPFILSHLSLLSLLPARLKPIFKLALPLMGSQLASIGIITADIIMMGALSGFDLAAGSLAIRFYQPFYFFSLGLTAVIASLIAQAIGRGDPTQARRVFRMGLVIALGVGLIASPVVIFGEPLLLALQQEPDVVAHARGFLFYSGMGLPLFFIFLVMRFFVMGNQHTTAQLLVTIGGLLVNVSLNQLFGFGGLGLMGWGLDGIAIATLGAYLFMVVALGLYINWHRDFRHMKPFARLWRLDVPLIGYIVRIGFPNAVIVMSETGMFIVAGFMIGTFGTAALISTGIANQIAAVTFMVPLAVSQASAILVGNAAGADDKGAVARMGNAGHVAGWLVAIPMTLLYLIFAEELAMLFIQETDPLFTEVMPILVLMLFYVGLFQLVDGLQVIENAKLRGINDTKEPAKIALLSYWVVGLGCAYLFAFSFQWGPASVWAGLGIGLAAATFILSYRWLWHMRAIANGRAILIR